MVEDSAAQPPVLWSLDAARTAAAIYCEVCRLCRWRNPQQTVVCQYGGPFDGYQSPEGALLEIVQDDKG